MPPGDQHRHGDNHAQSSRYSVGGLLLVWLGLSVSLVMLNKHVMSATPCRFPLTLALLHMSTGLALAHVCLRLFPATSKSPSAKASSGGEGRATGTRYRLQVWTVGALLAGVLLTSNAAFARLSVAMIQMLKASTPVTIFLLGVALRAESYDRIKAINVLVIAFGVILSANGGAAFDATGVFLQMTSIVLDSLRCLLLQKVVSGSGVTLDPLTALVRVAPSAVAVLFLPALALEWPELRSSTCLETSWRYLALSCAIAFSLNLVVCALIGATSALTTSVSGILKDFVCIALAMALHGVRIGLWQWTGYAIAISALGVYHSRRSRASTPLKTVVAAAEDKRKNLLGGAPAEKADKPIKGNEAVEEV